MGGGLSMCAYVWERVRVCRGLQRAPHGLGEWDCGSFDSGDILRPLAPLEADRDIIIRVEGRRGGGTGSRLPAVSIGEGGGGMGRTQNRDTLPKQAQPKVASAFGGVLCFCGTMRGL